MPERGLPAGAGAASTDLPHPASAAIFATATPADDAGAWSRPAIVLAGAVLLLWPTLLNEHPYLFWDTYGYFLQGKAYWRLVLGALHVAPAPPETAGGWVGAGARMLATDPAIRSVSWSLLTYALAVTGSFWLLACANALVAAAMVELALLRLFQLRVVQRLTILAVLALVTPLSWFASYLMPDLYAGLLVLAAASLAFAWAVLRTVERIGVLVLYGASITFHGSHLLLALGLAGVALALPAAAGERWVRACRLAAPILAASVAMLAASWFLFGQATLTPQAPPFLLARSWEDGPVRAYLARTCPDAGWSICAHVDRLAPTAQEFLWQPENSYWSMSLEERAAVRAEEMAVVGRAGAADPLAQLVASLANAARQLVRFGLDDFVPGRGAAVNPEDYTFVYLPTVPAAVWGLAGFSAAIRLVTTAALVALALQLGRGRIRTGCPAWASTVLVLAALLLNAAICGVLSGPNDRYQARIVWLLPLVAAAVTARPRGPAAPAP